MIRSSDDIEHYDIYDEMTPIHWNYIRYFSPDCAADNWGDPYKVKWGLVLYCDLLREFVKKPIIIHCAYERRPFSPASQHNYGFAADLHIKDLPLIEQFMAAVRFPFNGIGVYSWWNNPGLHCDIRRKLPHKPRSFWYSPEKGIYLPLDTEAFRKILIFNHHFQP